MNRAAGEATGNHGGSACIPQRSHHARHTGKNELCEELRHDSRVSFLAQAAAPAVGHAATVTCRDRSGTAGSFDAFLKLAGRQGFDAILDEPKANRDAAESASQPTNETNVE